MTPNTGNLLLGEKNDLWAVNAVQAYQVRDERERYAVGKVVEAAAARVFAKLDRLVFGIPWGRRVQRHPSRPLSLVIKGGGWTSPATP